MHLILNNWQIDEYCNLLVKILSKQRYILLNNSNDNLWQSEQTILVTFAVFTIHINGSMTFYLDYSIIEKKIRYDCYANGRVTKHRNCPEDLSLS